METRIRSRMVNFSELISNLEEGECIELELYLFGNTRIFKGEVKSIREKYPNYIVRLENSDGEIKEIISTNEDYLDIDKSINADCFVKDNNRIYKIKSLNKKF